MTDWFKDFYYSKPVVRRYAVTTHKKLICPLRLALISDLHGCLYGPGGSQDRVLEALRNLKPHAVLLGGDMTDERHAPAQKNLELFLRGVCGEYPVFFVTGNHEARLNRPQSIKGLLSGKGVTVLDGQRARLRASGAEIDIMGVDDPEYCGGKRFRKQLDSAFSGSSSGILRVLLAHRPEFFPLYAKYRPDLVLTGHTHGGQWRIPWLVNGIYASGQGLFPRYGGGLYAQKGSAMVVSRGLARESTPLFPRLFNPPELVLVEIVPVGHI